MLCDLYWTDLEATLYILSHIGMHLPLLQMHGVHNDTTHTGQERNVLSLYGPRLYEAKLSLVI